MAVLLADLVAASDAATATRSRKAKCAVFADVLRRLAPAETEAAVGFLIGWPRQGKVGVGWGSLGGLSLAPAMEPTLTVADIDAALARLATTSGPGSQSARREQLIELLGAATRPEQSFLQRLLLGELRQGALEGLLTEAIAEAAQVPAGLVRRAAMLSGDLGRTAEVAFHGGGAPALAAVGLAVQRPVQPMLAATAASVSEAIAETGLASVEWKLDGARVQLHKAGDEVRAFTRNLNDVTMRIPGVVRAVQALPARRVVLDGEVIGLSEDEVERPRRFQDTMARFGTGAGDGGLRAFVFDVLHVDGTDLIDEPLERRLSVLEDVAGSMRIPSIVTADAPQAEAFADAALAAGHEGVMVKAIGSRYEAGRRGGLWRKVKPVRTLDLVVIAVEEGSGRRTGRLSNLHLGARDPDRPGTFVMVGKTFKGLTDELLTWQTEQLLAREIGREAHIVHVRPELVVEIALDGVMASTRYPGGVSLRFARVRRYRPDKRAEDADTIQAVQALLH